jgi:hypothetical protein
MKTRERDVKNFFSYSPPEEIFESATKIAGIGKSLRMRFLLLWVLGLSASRKAALGVYAGG